MKTKDFSFDLPEHLIAALPVERGETRLMALDCAAGKLSHYTVKDLPDLLEPGTVLVFNNSKVRKARLPGVSIKTGARTEFLLLNKVAVTEAGLPLSGGAVEGTALNHAADSGALAGRVWKAMVQRAKRRRIGSRYAFADSVEGEIVGEDGEFRLIAFDRPLDDAWLDLHGHIPLPPYIKREDTPLDSERYQTVYAKVTGSAAAPTAGLHFTREILDALEQRGMETAFVTLHVGLGTFLPIRTQNIEDHKMHEECYAISDETADRIEKAKQEGRKILAVGTTSVRTLESAWDEKAQKLRRGEGATSIFIYPGYSFKAVDILFTNFHTPGSTLLLLASAFAGAKAAPPHDAPTGRSDSIPTGRDLMLKSYAEAIRNGYRFFSYGDAMLIR
jgi:S-adenosylmethionine:tRNA ribosyltransferase-isomerase